MQAEWRSRTLQAEPWKLWEKGRYWGQIFRIKKKRTSLSVEELDYVKRAAKYHTEERIRAQLGVQHSLYASAAEREQERKALLTASMEQRLHDIFGEQSFAPRSPEASVAPSS